MTWFYPPLPGLFTHLRERWRNRSACRHESWTPLGGCPCGKW